MFLVRRWQSWSASTLHFSCTASGTTADGWPCLAIHRQAILPMTVLFRYLRLPLTWPLASAQVCSRALASRSLRVSLSAALLWQFFSCSSRRAIHPSLCPPSFPPQSVSLRYLSFCRWYTFGCSLPNHAHPRHLTARSVRRSSRMMTRPLYGSLSLAAPFVALLFALAGHAFLQAFTFVKNQSEWPVFVFALLLSPIGGVITGTVGLARRERHRWLAVLGLILNVGIICGFRPPTF